MTVSALDRIEECIRRGDDATADEFRDALAAMDDLDELVEANRRFAGRLDAPEYLRAALARVTGEQS